MARTAATPTPVPMAWQRGWIAWTGWWISRARGAVRTRGERRRRARARARMRRRQRTCRSGRGVHRRGRVTNGASRGLTLFVTWRVPTENRDEAGVLFPTTTLAAKSSKKFLEVFFFDKISCGISFTDHLKVGIVDACTARVVARASRASLCVPRPRYEIREKRVVVRFRRSHISRDFLQLGRVVVG